MSDNPTLQSDAHGHLERIASGQVLRERLAQPSCVLHLQSGRVVLGVHECGAMRHQLGVVEGPAWLDAAPALLGEPCMVDMVAETDVQLRRVPLDAFRSEFAQLPAPVQSLLHDMARSYCQQTEIAVSRLAQDAEGRCAQWLLRHAQKDDSGALRVTLQQRKRMIAAQLGIAPETFSRVLRHLRDSGLIAGAGNVLRLLQPQALQQVAGGG